MEWQEACNNLIETNIGVERCLNISEDHERTIGTSTTVPIINCAHSTQSARVCSPELALSLKGRGECNSVVEGEAESLMSFVATLVVEQVVLQVIPDSEQTTTSCVRGRVDTIRA